MEQIDCLVVGAGVIGLAVARELALRGQEVIILEATSVIGSEISSRNSGVIHAGIYYPKDGLKARFCVEGKHRLYQFCSEHGVEHSRIGKLLVATEETQLESLDTYQQLALGNGVEDLTYLSAAEIHQLEPAVECAAGLLSPSTGIIDVHDYMLALQGVAEDHGVFIAFNTPVIGARATARGFTVEVGGTSPASIGCRHLVNAAGLNAQSVAGTIVGLDVAHIPPIFFAKGNYFHLTTRSPFKRLVYPMPTRGSLGVHVSFDLAGRVRFGPDICWIDKIDYDVDESRAALFYGAIRRYWPGLPDDSLAPDYTGVRPKLGPAGAPPSDFVIQTSREHGLSGLVNLFGIESPGLTSSLALADHVADGLEQEES